MTMSDHELAQTEILLRQRLTQLADHAPTAVHTMGEVPVVRETQRVRRGRRAGMSVAVAALLGAGGFTTYSFLGASDEGGATTPAEAVTAFVSAAENEDLFGMIDVTAPEEVAALRSAFESMASDAKRVDLLADEFDLSGVQGIDVSVDNLALDTNFLEGGLAIVSATGGTFAATFDPQAFPAGDKIRELFVSGQEGNSFLADLDTGDKPFLLMTVERNSRWYVSLEYTMAEYVRQASDWELPGSVNRTAVGFDSAEAAATSFFDQVAALDLQAAIDTFAPGEDAMAWLAQSWVADAQAAIDQARADGLSMTVSDLTYETLGDEGNTLLRPITFKVEGTVPPDFNQDTLEPTEVPQAFTIERADGCTTITGVLADSMFGTEPPPTVTPIEGGYQVCGTGNGMFGGLLLLVSGSALELPPIAVVQSGDKWFVSPLGTALASVSVTLHDITDGASLFDTAFAPYIYSGLNRAWLESLVVDRTVDSIDRACLPALTVENGIVTGVVADPPLAVIRACAGADLFLGETAIESGVEAPVPATTP